MKAIKRYEISESVEAMASALFDIPYNSYDVSCELIEKQKEINRLKEIIRQIEDRLIIEISDEKDNNGKLKFSNQSVREAEMRLRLDSNNRYWDLKKEIEDISVDCSKMKEQANAYAQMFSTIKNEVYYRRRLEELDSMRELSKNKASEIKTME